MASADFLAHRKRIYSKTSLGKVNILVPIAATSAISVLSSFEVLDFGSMWYLIRPDGLGMLSHILAQHSRAAPIQYRHCSLAYFSPNFTVSNDFVHSNKVPLAWLPGNDSSAYGTCTLWNAQFHELYSPFKAHTNAKNEYANETFGKVFVKLM
jgi:hypothetical protein